MHQAIKEASESGGVIGPPKFPSSFESGLRERLADAIECLLPLQDQCTSAIASIDQLLKRLADGRFILAVLGQFKSGKSTLLNALIGETVLPSAVLPATSIPTIVSWGESLRVRVVYNDDRPATMLTAGQTGDLAQCLSRFVTEAGNPRNHLGISQVEVFHPSSILKQGLVLVDTPGFGATLRHRMDATLNFLPQCDAAMFLVGIDPLITMDLEFLKKVRSKVRRLFFIINKSDFLGSQGREAAVCSLRTMLTEHVGLGGDTRIFCVSALEALGSRHLNDRAALTESGLPEVLEHVNAFLVRGKSVASRAAISLKAADVLDDAVLQLRLTIRCLQMPTEEVEARRALFDRQLEDIRRERTLAAELLARERTSLNEVLESLAEQMRHRGQAYLRGVAQAALAGLDPGKVGEILIRFALAAVIPDFFDHEMSEITADFSKRVAEASRHFQERANALIELVRKTAAGLFDVSYDAPESAGLPEETHDPFWINHDWTGSLKPVRPNMLDRILPSRNRLSRIEHRIAEQIDMLVARNVEILRWSTYLSFDEAFSRLDTSFDERLADTINATHGAITAALAKHKQVEQVAPEGISTLQRCAAQLIGIAAALRDASRCGTRNDAAGLHSHGAV